MPPGWCRRVWRLGVLATLLLTGALAGQTYDLSVAYITPPPNPTVQLAGNFAIGVSVPVGASGVTVTAVFTPAVTFNAPPASSAGCVANSAAGDPSITVTCPATGATSVTINVTPLTVGSLSVVAGIIGNEYDAVMTNNSATMSVTVAGSSVQPPTGLAATQTGQTVILVTWAAPAGGADSYEVSRTETVGGSYTVLSPNPTTTSFSDTSAVTGHTYIYRARANRGGTWSGYSNVDPASLFTDFTITQYSTTAKAAHVTELRTAIDIRRALALLSPGAWTPTITPGVTIQRGDIQQMRDLLDQAMGAGSYTDQPLTGYAPGVVLIKKEHIQQLRNRVQ